MDPNATTVYVVEPDATIHSCYFITDAGAYRLA